MVKLVSLSVISLTVTVSKNLSMALSEDLVYVICTFKNNRFSRVTEYLSYLNKLNFMEKLKGRDYMPDTGNQRVKNKEITKRNAGGKVKGSWKEEYGCTRLRNRSEKSQAV